MFFESIGNFFKGIFDAGTTVNNIFAFLASHLIYLLAGALVAFVIILIWSLILKQIPNWIICTLVAIACIGTSFGIALLIENNAKPNTDATPEVISKIDDEINKKINGDYKNTNGGFTYNQVIASQNDSECPTADDVIIELNVKDFGDYVDFYYVDESNMYYNAVFVKNGENLIYDGMLNTSCGFRKTNTPWWKLLLTLGIAREYDIDSFEWETDYKNAPYYSDKARKWGLGALTGTYDNLLTETRLTEYKYSFNNFQWNYLNRDEAKNLVKTNVIDYISNNTAFFQKFGDVELSNIVDINSKPARVIYNTFYTYLLQQMADVENGESKTIDVTSLMCKPIPVELQSNYPISNTAKQNHSEYANATNYAVYKCNIFVKLNKIGEKTKIGISSHAGGVLNTIKTNGSGEVIKIGGDIQSLSTPTNLTWDSENIGTAKWGAVTKIGSVDFTYTVTLYCDDALVGTYSNISTNYKDFADIIRNKKMSGIYTFKVQAVSANKNSVANSEVSDVSSILTAVKITILKAEGVSSATIDVSTSYVFIKGQRPVALVTSVREGYTFDGWLQSENIATIGNYKNKSTEITDISFASGRDITITATASKENVGIVDEM